MPDDPAKSGLSGRFRDTMKSKLLTLAMAVAVALTVSVGGAAAAEHVYSLSDEDSSDELPEEYDLTVIDPDEQLTDDQVDTALELAWQHDDVRAAFEESETYNITVQAAGLEDVTVIIDGNDDEASGVVVDLEAETVTDIHAGDQIHSAQSVESVSLDAQEVGNDTNVVHVSDTESDVVVTNSDNASATAIETQSADTTERSEDSGDDFTLADSSIEFVDEDSLLSDEEMTRVEELLVTDDSVDSHVGELVETDSDVTEWTATVSDVEDSVFVSNEDDIVDIELTHEDTEDAVSVLLDLEEMEIVEVVAVTTLDVSDSEAVDVTLGEDGDTITVDGDDFDGDDDQNDQ